MPVQETSAGSTGESEAPQQLPRGRHGLTREAVTQSQRQRTLRGMIEAVAERGYAETRVVDAIDLGGVSRKTFYELFADKEDCFLAAYDAVFSRFYERTMAAYEADSQAPWTDRLRAALATLLEELAKDPAAARFWVVEALAAGPKAVSRRDAAIREFTHFVDAGRAQSNLDLPGITSTAIVGGIFELLYSDILHGATSRLPARLPEIVFWVTQPFLGAERASEQRRKAREAAESPT
jgi:AcrR family transcriptional regulator